MSTIPDKLIDGARDLAAWFLGRHWPRPDFEVGQPPERDKLEAIDIEDFLKRGKLTQEGSLNTYTFDEHAQSRLHITGTLRARTKIVGLNLTYCEISLSLRESMEFKACNISWVRMAIDTAMHDHSLLIVDSECRTLTLLMLGKPVNEALDASLRLHSISAVSHLMEARLAAEGDHAYGVVQISRTDIGEFLIGGAMNRLIMQNVMLRKGVATGFMRDLTLRESESQGVFFNGSVSAWTSAKALIKGGAWMPRISNNARFEATSFPDAFVDVSQISARCSDRSGVDLREAYTDDRWERLRDSYTGIKFFFHLFFFLVFLLPIALKIGSHLLFANPEGQVEKMMEHLRGSHQYMDVKVWELVIFGTHTGVDRVTYGSLSICLILFNIFRIVLTVQVSAIREHEEMLQSYDFIKTRPTDKRLRWLWLFHAWFMRWLVWAALISLIWRAVDIALTTVRIAA